jgi:hypothetical protein
MDANFVRLTILFGAASKTKDTHAMSDTVESYGPEGYLETLVAATLDDLEEGRLDIESALRKLARVAWEAGRRYEREGFLGST